MTDPRTARAQRRRAAWFRCALAHEHRNHAELAQAWEDYRAAVVAQMLHGDRTHATVEETLKDRADHLGIAWR